MLSVTPVCASCKLEMRRIENGVAVVEMAHEPPMPYICYYADLFVCTCCGVQVLSGFGAPQHVNGDAGEYARFAARADRIFPVYESMEIKQKWAGDDGYAGVGRSG